MPAEWTLQDAETKFRDVYNAARTGEPQYIREDGKVGAVVLPITSSAARELSKEKAEPPLSFAEFLLTMPKGDWLEEENIKPLKLRDVEF